MNRRPFASIRWKVLLAFFFIIGLSFLIMAGTLTNMLGDYLFSARIRSDRAGLEKWAVMAAEPLSEGNARGIENIVHRAARNWAAACSAGQ